MANILPTIKVVEKKTKIEMVINECDFDEELYEVKDKAEKKADKAEKKADKAEKKAEAEKAEKLEAEKKAEAEKAEKLEAEMKALMGEK